MFYKNLIFPIKIIYKLIVIFYQYIIDKFAKFIGRNDEICKNFWNYGVHIFDELLSKSQIDDLLLEFDDLIKIKGLELDGQSNGRIFAYGALSPLISEHANKVIPIVQKILNTKKIKIEISYYQHSKKENNILDVPGGSLHVDDSKANVKYFIYLTNVDHINGPFSVVSGTGSWKLKSSLLRALLWDLTGKRKYLYDFFLNVKELLPKEIQITGLCGTRFLVDTTSLHRGMPVVKGERKVAVISFNRVH